VGVREEGGEGSCDKGLSELHVRGTRFRAQRDITASLLTAPQRDLPPLTRKGEDRATPFREPHRRAHQQKELTCKWDGCERAREVVSLVALFPFVSTPRILRKYRSRNGIERRVLAVLGGMFRCKEIKEGLEGDGGVCEVLVGICV